MKLGLIDVREWQSLVDLRTGIKQERFAADSFLGQLENLLKIHPYPGDLSLDSLQWVTDLAIGIDQFLRPGFIFVSYANPYFRALFSPGDELKWSETIGQLRAQLERLLTSIDCVPVVAGLGGSIPFQSYIDLTCLDGMVHGGGMDVSYAGLFDASQADLRYVNKHPLVERVISRDELLQAWNWDLQSSQRLPEYLIAAQPGYVFRSLGSLSRKLYRVSRQDTIIPIHSPIPIQDIGEVANVVRNLLAADKRVLLVLLEGIGIDDFPIEFQEVNNSFGWYTYTPGDLQYLTITRGRHLPEHPYPPGCKYYEEDDEDKPYPFSGIYSDLPDDVIGADPGVLSAAVGSRSILTHMASGADLSVECFARSLYNYGTLAVINDSLLDGPGK